jgi:cytoskeletal protein RodZ
MAGVREGLAGGGLEQATSVPTISAVDTRRRSVNFMGLILLEALLALVVLVAIVWWTMFSGRQGGELKKPASKGDDKKPPPSL